MTETSKWAGRCFVIALITAVNVSAQTTRTDEQVIRDLASQDQHARESAVDYVRKNILPGQRTPALEASLVRELTRLNELRRVRRETDRAGKPLVDDFPAEYYRDVIELVGQSSNGVVVDALAGALGTGTLVQDSLARFGATGVPTLLAVGRSKVGSVVGGLPGDVPPEIVADALTTLQRVLDNSRTPVSSESRAQILALARERLSGHQHGVVLIAACRLALATKDETLRARVVQLADDRAAVAALGVSDPRWANQVQLAARRALGR